MRSSKPARIADLVYFFDTSALAKLYHPELGTDTVTAIVQSTPRMLFVSQLVTVEMASVAAIKVRRGEMSLPKPTRCFAKSPSTWLWETYWSTESTTRSMLPPPTYSPATQDSIRLELSTPFI